MTVKLNHTIVHSVDKRAAADFFAGVFGLPAPKPFYDFLDVEVGNEVTLAFLDADGMARPEGQGPHQPPLRRPRRLLPGPERPPARDHHAAL